MNVYVIAADVTPPLVKIGIAANASYRLSTLRTGSPYALNVAHSVSTDNARLVERLTHHNLAKQRSAGEWFKISPEEAIAAINSAVSEIANPDWQPPWNEGDGVKARPRRNPARTMLRMSVQTALVQQIAEIAKKEDRSTANMAERLLGEALKARKRKVR